MKFSNLSDRQELFLTATSKAFEILENILGDVLINIICCIALVDNLELFYSCRAVFVAAPADNNSAGVFYKHTRIER